MVEPMPGVGEAVPVGVNSAGGVRVSVGLTVMDGISVGGTVVRLGDSGADPQAASRNKNVVMRSVIFKVCH